MRSFSNKNAKKYLSCGPRSPENAEYGHFTLLFCRERQRNLPGIMTCTAIVLLIKPFVWWYITGRFKRKAKTNIKLFVHLLHNWTKTSLSFFVGNKHINLRERRPLVQSCFLSMCTGPWTRLHVFWFMCSCLRMLAYWLKTCSHGWKVSRLIG